MRISTIIKIVLFLFLFSLPVSLFCQANQIKFDHITVEDGLSHSSVFEIMQDSKGFLWFGTQDGLNKYDGYSFKVYKYSPFDTTSLQDNWVQSVVEDKNGLLWVGTHNSGVFKFDRDNETFVNYKNIRSNHHSLANNRVWDVFIDSENVLWVGSSGGLSRFDAKQNRFENYSNKSGDPYSFGPFAANCIYESSKDALWVGTWGGGLVKFDKKTSRFHHFLFDTPKRRAQNKIKAIAGDQNGYIWLATSGDGLIKFNTKDGSFTQYLYDPLNPASISDDHLISIFIDKKNRIWVGAHDGGLNRFDQQTGKFFRYVNNPDDRYSLSDNWVQSIYEDASGIVWVGTGLGLNKCVPIKQLFSYHSLNYAEWQNANFNEINSIFEDSNRDIWVGTWNQGLIKYNPRNKSIEVFKENEKKNSLPTNIIWTIYEDRDKNLWVGTFEGLCLYDRNKKEFKRFANNKKDPYSISHNNISAIYEDSRGNLWIGTWDGGLNRYDKRTGRFFNYRKDPANPKSLSDDLITVIREDRNKNLWIGTNAGGLNIFNYQDNTFSKYLYDAKNNKSLSNNTIRSLYEDSKGNIWVGTWGGGINKFNSKTQIFERFTEKDGLANNVIYGILEDGKGYLWISTNKGISRFDPVKRIFANYDVEDGIGNSQYSGGHAKCADGTIIFGGAKGLTAFMPDSIQINNFHPPIIITSFKKFNREIKLGKDISDIKDVQIDYDDNVFSFEFAALDFTRPDKNKYAYMLEGFDKNWNYIGSNRTAYYTNLYPGDYILKIKASNSDNIWSEKIIQVRIQIIPPYYLTWWFASLTAITMAFIVFGIYRYRVNQLLEIERVRTKIAADLHDDIAANLSSIAMFSQIVKDEACPEIRNNQVAITLLDRILFLSKESVVAIRDIIWAIDPKPESAYDLLLKARDTVINSCRAKNINFVFEVPSRELFPAENLPPDKRKDLYLLIKESLNNSIKHSECANLLFAASYDNSLLKIYIKDDGIGFDLDSRKEGKGLGTMRKRAESIKAGYSLNSQKGKGTYINIKVRI